MAKASKQSNIEQIKAIRDRVQADPPAQLAQNSRVYLLAFIDAVLGELEARKGKGAKG